MAFEGDSMVNRPTSMMFGDAMVSDHDDSERSTWHCFSLGRLSTMNFWYWFRTTLPFTWPFLFFGTFLVPYFFFNHSDGYIFTGSMLSAFFCVLALMSYWQIRPWRRHPSILIIMICFISIIISAFLIYNAAPHGGDQEIDKSDVDVIENSSFSASDRTPSCVIMSFFIQLTLLARESWILTLSLDLLTSITNPFASYKTSLRQYHAYIWFFTTLLAVILASSKSCQGEFLSNGTCWLRISGADSVCFWGFFMSWVIMFYVNAAAVLAYAFSRVSKGLESTYATRYACVADTFRVVFLYFIYGMIIAVLFLVIYYSSQSGISDEKLYFLEHCFAYLIACRGFIDALIWFFSHGFVSERGVVTNLSVVTATTKTPATSSQRRRSRRSTPSKSSSNRYPFADPSSSEANDAQEENGNLTEPEDEDGDDEDEERDVSGMKRGRLLTLSDVFMPDRSLRGLFNGIFFSTGPKENEDAVDADDRANAGGQNGSDDNGSVDAVRSTPKRRSWPTTSDSTSQVNNNLAEALLSKEESKADVTSRSRSRRFGDKEDGEEVGSGPASIASRTTRDTYEVDVSPQLNLALREEVVQLVTRGIQESVTRMINRDRQLRNQLAEIGVMVLDERDYFQDAEDDEFGSDGEEESDKDYEESVEESSEGYDSSSSTEGYDSQMSDSSIHSLLSSQHSARSLGLIPAPASALPSSMVAARRVLPIQRTTKNKPDNERKSGNKNRPSNSSGSKSKHSRPSDGKNRSSKSKGKNSKRKESEDESVGNGISPFADLTAAHRAGVAPPANDQFSTSIVETQNSSSSSIPAPTSQYESMISHKAELGITTKESTSPKHNRHASARHPHTSTHHPHQLSTQHHNHRRSLSHHIPSNIYLTNVNHSFHFRPAIDIEPASAASASASASASTSMSSSQQAKPFVSSSLSSSASPLHGNKTGNSSSPATSPLQGKLKNSSSTSTQNNNVTNTHSHLHHPHAASVSMSAALPHARSPTPPVTGSHHHYENTVIQNLMSIVGGQYYPGEYGVDNIAGSAAGGLTSSLKDSHKYPTSAADGYHHHNKHHHHQHHQNSPAQTSMHHSSYSQTRHSLAHAPSHSNNNSARMSLSKALSASMSFRFLHPANNNAVGTHTNPLLAQESSSKKRNKLSSVGKTEGDVREQLDEEEGGGEGNTHQEAKKRSDRDISVDSQISNTSFQGSRSSSNSSTSSNGGSRVSNTTLRQRKQAILNEFRPPGIVVFYFDRQRHRFRDFRPATFRQLRSLAGISEEDYLRFIQQPTQERLSEGRSGAFFFICGAGELVVKTIAQSEAMTLLKILDEYRAHFVQHPDSLIVRFLGLHSITLYGTEFYFVVMKNIFPPGQRLQERYDLKGSYIARNTKANNRPGSIATCRHCGAVYVVGDPAQGLDGGGSGAHGSSGGSGGHSRGSGSDRMSGQSGRPSASRRPRPKNGVLEAGSVCPEMAGGHEPSITLKDNDLTSKIRLHPEDALQVIETLFNDSDALASMGLMDYSLLVGVQHVHYDLQESQTQAMHSSQLANNAHTASYRSYPARVVIAPNQYYFGIIDILQTWDYTKKVEHFIKVNVLGQPYDGISAIPPQDFKRRFQRKIASVIDHASLIREVTGSWQGKREVGNVYSLTSLPPNLAVIPTNWSTNVTDPASNHQSSNNSNIPSNNNSNNNLLGRHSHSSSHQDLLHNNREDHHHEVDLLLLDTTSNHSINDSYTLRDSLTSRHSLIISADQGAANSNYDYDYNYNYNDAYDGDEDARHQRELMLSVSPTTTLRNIIADRNSFREKS